MKYIILLLNFLPLLMTGQNNPEASAIIQEKMSQLSNWIGQWQGEGSIAMMGTSHAFFSNRGH